MSREARPASRGMDSLPSDSDCMGRVAVSQVGGRQEGEIPER